MLDESIQPDLPSWRRVRRYAVPQRMIARTTARRLAGDWRGACAAANVEVAFDEADLVEAYGARTAARLIDELTGFAPDLLRWHLPRALRGRTGLATERSFVLAPKVTRVTDDMPRLAVLLPAFVDGSQRLRLEIRDTGGTPELPAFLWDAREAHRLRAVWGGSAERMPFLAPDGTPLTQQRQQELAGSDSATRAEDIAALLAMGDLDAAWELAGIPLVSEHVDDEVKPVSHHYGAKAVRDVLRSRGQARQLNLVGLRLLVDDLTARHGVAAMGLTFGGQARMVVRRGADGGLTARLPAHGVSFVDLPELLHRRPVDLDLLHHGMITLDELHPLVRAAVLPGAPTASPAAPRPVSEPVRVRCRGAWHQVRPDPGGLLLLDHSAEEMLREQTLHSLGGAVAGCFATRLAWQTGSGRLPRRLRAQRIDLMQLVLHGDADEALDLLDRGMDPSIRDGRGFTLLHLLSYLEHERLLPRLLAAGVPVDARDREGRTPLHVAVKRATSLPLVRALTEAGADPYAEDRHGMSPWRWVLLLTDSSEEEDGDEDDEVLRRLGTPSARRLLIRRYLEQWRRRDDFG
ncbi:ankyrin repeat domain-containing protein [Catellatospora tritici]|uniref:ankyrin repeat domain-containing protein n=1 Tax=Catellatospora tritici TaxID=2851566 RepID=UPI001C2D1DC8|nr:ankyrin repeat domain-containing protein [Catellatospora tritici]MBV1850202.1 ankyrin repeat domain-containing protein [Catellatospora tritici]